MTKVAEKTEQKIRRALEKTGAFSAEQVGDLVKRIVAEIEEAED